MKRKRGVFIEGAAPTDGELLLRRIAVSLAAGRLPRVADRRAFVAAIERLAPGASGKDAATALGLTRKRGGPPLTKRERWARQDVPVGVVVAAMSEIPGMTKDLALDMVSRGLGIKRSYLEDAYKSRARIVRGTLLPTTYHPAGYNPWGKK